MRRLLLITLCLLCCAWQQGPQTGVYTFQGQGNLPSILSGLANPQRNNIPFGNGSGGYSLITPQGDITPGKILGNWLVQGAHWSQQTCSTSPCQVTASIVNCDAQSGQIDLQLPGAAGTSFYTWVEKSDPTNNACVLTPASSDTINGQPTVAFTVQYQSVFLDDLTAGDWLASAGTIPGSLVGTGTFPLTTTANFNNFSAININSLSFIDASSPTPVGTATCGGTCATQYTYEITCNGDAGTQSSPGGQLGLVNADSLDFTNFNTISWASVPGCASYTVYGRVNGSLGALETCPGGPNCDSANSYHDPGNDGVGTAPPAVSSTGGILGDLHVSGDVNADGQLNGATLFVNGAGTFEAGLNLSGGNPQLVIDGGSGSNQEVRLNGAGSAHSYAMEVQNNDTWKLGDRTTLKNVMVADQLTGEMNFPQGIESTTGGGVTTNGGTIPAVSCAASGTATMTANSTSTSGSFTVGSSTTGNCTLTFATACANAINCTRPNDASATIDLYAVPGGTSSVQITQNAGANLANHKIYYMCGCN